MTPQHPNYSRQMVKQFMPFLESSDEEDAPIWNALDLAKRSQKFCLPSGGRLYDDKQFRALDENDLLRLPFPVIALEYLSDEKKEPRENEVKVSKKIVFAREQDELIVMTVVAWVDKYKAWYPYPEIGLPNRGYLNRALISSDGYVAINCIMADPRIPLSDYEDEVGSLLCFLNALQCSNVHIQKSPSKKSGKKVKSALPFDDYYLLDVEVSSKSGSGSGGGTHRSPREHLRRGHIRRLESGRRIWVNAAVVGAGKGAGKIHKDYNMKAPA